MPFYLKYFFFEKYFLQVATRIIKFLVDNFGASNLFGRVNYEFYARITGRVLKVEEDWIFSFRYPPDTLVPREYNRLLNISLITYLKSQIILNI